MAEKRKQDTPVVCKCYYKNVQKVENKNVHSKDMC